LPDHPLNETGYAQAYRLQHAIRAALTSSTDVSSPLEAAAVRSLVSAQVRCQSGAHWQTKASAHHGAIPPRHRRSGAHRWLARYRPRSWLCRWWPLMAL